MLKKVINYLAIFLFSISLVSPAFVSASGASLYSTTMNSSAGRSSWIASETAKVGDDVYFSMKFINDSSAKSSGLKARVVLPSGLQYVSNYAKIYYKDASGNTQSIPMNDSIVSGGASLGIDVPAGVTVYVSYKTKAVAAGTFSPSNYISGGNINVSNSSASVVVSGNTSTTTTTTTTTTTGSTTVASGTGTNQPAMSMISSVINYTKGGTSYTSAITADKGDEAFYRVAITNNGDAAATGLQFRAVIPASLEYVNNYAKVYYKENGVDKQSPASDGIISTNGIILADIPAHTFIYVTYKVKVRANAAAGTSATSNQLSGNNGISMADNSGVITVSGTAVTPEQSKSLALGATAYNLTTNKSVGYSNNINASRGDTVKFRVDFSNNGDVTLNNVVIKNILPENMEYVGGTLKAVLAGKTVSTADNITSGVSLGDISKGANGYIEFQGKVKNDTPTSISKLTYTASATANGIGAVNSTVTITLGVSGDNGNLPDTGMPTTILSLILLAMFLSTSAYVYLKETGKLKAVAAIIKR